MTRQRNKFLTFLFSLMPGCGQMFMGFMKRGISLLFLFLLTIISSSILNLGEIGYIAIFIWCWAFFDSLNLMSLPPEKFQTLEDDFLISGKSRALSESRLPAGKMLRYFGIALILIGALSLWNGIFDYIYDTFYYNAYIAELIYRLNYYIPRLVLSILIILIGAKLIRRKKNETQKYEPQEGIADDQEIQ